MPETILTYCGFVRLDNTKGITVTTWIAPEVVMLVTAFLTFTLCTKLTAPSTELTTEEGEPQIKIKQKRSFGFWVSVADTYVSFISAKYVGLISLCVAAVLRPSIPGAFYFLVFIGSCTWWACYRELEKAFVIICRIVMVVVFLHIACLYAYQFEWTQDKVNVSSPYIKYLGIEPLYNTSCENPREIVWMPIQWDSYINPLALIWLFYILAIVSRNMLKPKLMRGVSPSRRYGAGSKMSGSNIVQDSTGSVTVTEHLDIPLHNLAEEEDEKPGCFDHVVFIVESVIQFIIQSSYVVTNIIMMTWSITYHSWLTFVLLLWANILWMIPNQRRSMLRSSPVLVCYAIFLLLSAYVYSMNIDELPSTIYGISLEQIGFNKVTEFPCKPLMVKCLFTVMFWITMRQHMKEIREARQSTTLAEMAAPLQVSVTAATVKCIILCGDNDGGDGVVDNRQKTTVESGYGALHSDWLKFKFRPGIAVRSRSQPLASAACDHCNSLEEVIRQAQLDIGLEKYNPAQLFIRLATPTFFVIVTVVQLHYFHHDFILYSTPTAQPILINPTSEEASSVQGKVLEQNKDKDEDVTDTSDITSLKIDLTDIGNFPWNQNTMLRELQEWAFLMDYQYPPVAQKLVLDVILLLFVARQAIVFRLEKNYKDQDYPGGSNESIIHNAEVKDFENPAPDFITFARSYLDVANRIIYLGWMWLTLAIVFLAGANRVNLFSIGYLVGSFMFLWQGSDIYLKPIPRILRLWNCLLGYNVFVMFSKTILQMVACVFIIDISNNCWIVQLLGIGCVRKFAISLKEVPMKPCDVPKDYIGLVWDGICFGFLIIQRRIFCSYSFFHVVDETKATTILASRGDDLMSSQFRDVCKVAYMFAGAELIEQLRQKRMHEQDEQERRILEKIKAKMDRIKATQQKMQGPFTSTNNHYVDQPPLARSSSVSSCASATSQQTPEAGYHTPIDEDEPAPLTPAAGSLIQPQAPSPFSAIMTVSLEGYLEPQRMSFSSPPNSELNPRPPSPDDSYPVFSPPPYDAAPPYAEVVNIPQVAPQRQHSIGPPWMNGALITPRQSIISYSSRSPLSHHTSVRSGDYYMFDDLDDDEDLEMIEELQPEREEMEDEEVPGTARKRTLGEVEESHVRLDSSPSSKGKKAAIDVIEPVPGTSKEEELSEIVEPKDSKFQKIIDILLFVWAFIDSTLVSLTNYLNKYSRDYRYVIKVLGREKKQLKQTSDYTEGIRMGRGQKWQPVSSYRSLLHRSQAIETARQNSANNSNSTTVQSAISDEKRPSSESSESKAQEAGSPLPYSPEKDSSQMHIIHQKFDEFDAGELSSYDQPTIIRFLLSIWYIILSHSDILCYFAIFLNQVRSATFLSLPLPLMVFFWGTLTVPRPSKNFWITIIAYTQMIVLIKCVFQFEFLPWNESSLQVSAINPARIFGVERRSQYAAYDLILLLIVYFHRYMLKCLGLWKTTVLVVPVFSDGPHMVDEGDVNPLKRADGNSPITLDDNDPQSTKTNNLRRGSDLEQLVEENEQEDEHDIDAGTMAEYRVDNVFNVTVKNKTVYDMFPDTLKMAPAKYFQAIKDFFIQLKDPTSRVTVDVYSYMFMCDFFNFFVILVGYSSFGCTRHVEDEYPQPRGERKTPNVKYLTGGVCLFVIIAIIWFPLVFFSLGNAVGEPNPPVDVTLDVRIGPYEPVYHLSAQSNAIYQFDESDVNALMTTYKMNKYVVDFINNYEHRDIVAIKLSQDSANLWSISPPDRKRMIDEVNSTSPISIRLQYIITHKSNQDASVIRDENVHIMPATVNGEPNTERQKLLEMLNSNASIDPIQIGYILPKFLKVTNRATAKPVPHMMDPVDGAPEAVELRRLTLKLMRDVINSELEWWEIQEDCNDTNYNKYLSELPYQDCSSIMLYAFNDKIFPEALGLITGGG
ncbi:hypothetical protein MML48_3g00017133 [Holotrichia oblita]|uniref:Uncharacterized protein n=1 Tax=Holotrichia oblita TaxID=644536 RepID=A0ACB9TD41_HOLOL|nr:hypothetical protein MML48_3g00017133 [Holotrichia oblita]